MSDIGKKAIIYIDGYNWYHAIFKHYPEWKWLNIQNFFERLRPHDNVISVKLFSALIDPDNPNSDARERQVKYFAALETLPKMKIIRGIFQPREVTCRADCKLKYIIPEEKKTDVNLAVEIISDAISGNCEMMCIVSGDSDIQPAIEWVAKNKREIKIIVYVPSLPKDQSARRIDYYKTNKINVECKFLPLEDIKNNQLPHLVKISEGKFSARPHVWTIPNQETPKCNS